MRACTLLVLVLTCGSAMVASGAIATPGGPGAMSPPQQGGGSSVTYQKNTLLPPVSRPQQGGGSSVTYQKNTLLPPVSRPQQGGGSSVDSKDGEVRLGVWLEVVIPGSVTPGGNSGNPGGPVCYLRQGHFSELMAWLENHYVAGPDPGEVYILKICKTDQDFELATFWVYQPVPPPAPTVRETTRLRNEAWGQLAIPEPATHMAPSRVTVVHIPTYVWVPAADRTPISATIATTLEGQELSLTATAHPRRLGFLRADMGDGNTLWCDAQDVVEFDPTRDPLDQPSGCFHYYRHPSVNRPDLRYSVVVTAYWEVSVQCEFNGGPCPNPLPAVPTQVLVAPPRPIAVAEVQALATSGWVALSHAPG
ncbi:hypothetical protein [Candidatus Poriferisocius sp.]|uniref:hypothetical protein n=1 Tax=Candidatus Poriferisocius sp. TaxID=3101276 RepID=UPI003B0266AB